MTAVTAVLRLTARDMPLQPSTAVISRALPTDLTTSSLWLADPLHEKTASVVETAAAKMIDVFREQGLSDYPSEFLEPHAYEILRGIQDPELRNMHVME